MSTAKCGVVIKSDVFDIARRLKEIDSGYFIVYNTAKRRYEVHNDGQKGNTFCLVVPYDCLDARTVELVQRTRVSNMDCLIEELEADNKSMEQRALNSQKEKIADIISQEVQFDSKKYIEQCQQFAESWH